MALIISKNGKNAKKIEKSVIDKEDYLQKYIYDNPESIPLYEIKDDIRVCILGREIPTNSGPIDALGVDADGEIYVIETKLYKNPDKRLVVAQVLDYGASLWADTIVFDEFINLFEKEAVKKFDMSIKERLKDFFKLTVEEVSILLENLKRNLGNGNFKFVVLMDRLEARLKDLIVFINQSSEFDIFAVELEYYKFKDYEILIPDLFGAEVKKNIKKSVKRKKWDESKFFQELDQLDKKYVKSIRKLYDFSKKEADQISWGTGVSRGSFNPKFKNVSVRSLYSVFTDGTLQINFGWLNDNEETLRKRKRYGKSLKKIDDLSIPKDFDESESYINIPIEDWYRHTDQFIEIIEGLVRD